VFWYGWFELSFPDLKGVANIRFTVVFRVGFPICFGLDWMGILHNEHHLAAKIGTFFAR
jgi:hypothetical protein